MDKEGACLNRVAGCGGQRPPSRGQWYVCEGETALCWGEEREPLVGRDQTVVFQVAISSL